MLDLTYVRLNITIKEQLCGAISTAAKDANGRYDDNIANIVHKQSGDNCNVNGIIMINKTPGLIMINQLSKGVS